MTRRATLCTDHGSRERARMVAAALRPDNTAEMETTVEGTEVVTAVERNSTGSLQSTVDDYVINVQLADRLTETQI
jgi:hypothetical protein